MKIRLCLAAFLMGIALLAFGVGSVHAAEAPRHSLAVGAAYLGGHVHVGLGAHWAAEARGLKGEADSSLGTINATTYGLRLYRYLRAPSRTRFFGGVEGAVIQASAESGSYETTGHAAGAFIGTEIYLTRRLSFTLDAGPYFFATKVTDAKLTQSGMEIVFSSALSFYLL